MQTRTLRLGVVMVGLVALGSAVGCQPAAPVDEDEGEGEATEAAAGAEPAGAGAGGDVELDAAEAQAIQPASAPVQTQSPRNANYTIEAVLDPDARTLEGRSVLTWRNISSRPASELRFHL